MNNKRVLGILSGLASGFLFGLMPLIATRIYAAGADPASVIFYRNLLPIPLLAFILWLSKIDFRLNKREAIDLFWLSALGYAPTGLLLFSSYRYLATGLATGIHFSFPLMVALGEILFLARKQSRYRLFCILLSALGVILMIDLSGSGSWKGIVISLASAVTYAYYLIRLQTSSLKAMNALKMTFYLNIVASAVLLLVIASGLFGNGLAYRFDSKTWLNMAFLAIGLTMVAVLLMQLSVRFCGAVPASVMSTLEPLTSVVVGFFLMQERLNVKSYLGIGAVLLALILIAKAEPGQKKEKKSQSNPEQIS